MCSCVGGLVHILTWERERVLQARLGNNLGRGPSPGCPIPWACLPTARERASSKQALGGMGRGAQEPPQVASPPVPGPRRPCAPSAHDPSLPKGTCSFRASAAAPAQPPPSQVPSVSLAPTSPRPDLPLLLRERLTGTGANGGDLSRCRTVWKTQLQFVSSDAFRASLNLTHV